MAEPPEHPTVSDMTAAYAQDAVDHAMATADIALDFSKESVAQVEAIIAQVRGTLPRGFLAKLFRGGPSSDDVLTLSKMYGCYLGEVLRRAHGGEWALVNGEVTFTNGRQYAWPTSKVFKRITDGDGDNIVFYFEVLVESWTRPSRPDGQ
jgi:hypothetical protein